jgi:adenosylhomocysteine nucleosidase
VIVVLAAMPSEIKPFLKRSPAGVLTGITGMGTVRATRKTEEMLAAGDVDRVIMIGVAGGLKGTTIGQVLVPEVVVDRATGRELRPEPFGGHVASGRLATGDEFTTDDGELAALEAVGITALDMETAAVGAVCEAHGVPWSVFRAISDRPSDRLVDESVFKLANPDGTPNLAAVARYVARRPWKIPALLRLGRDLNTATRAAASAALEALRA